MTWAGLVPYFGLAEIKQNLPPVPDLGCFGRCVARSEVKQVDQVVRVKTVGRWVRRGQVRRTRVRFLGQ